MTIYFEEAGVHTEEVLHLVKERAFQGDISAVLIATTKGTTIKAALQILKNIKDNSQKTVLLIAVTHQAGFIKPGKVELDENLREDFENRGVKVLTTTHAFAGVDRAVRKKHGTWQISELIAETLRIFGQGTKVCAEITLMAADSGLIGTNKVIAIGGTGRGADTAWVIQPAHTSTFFDLKMQELICKPINF
ncbi:MAG: hypothetical protein DRO88_03435 [Promethearchaeia archaeon]|nr:MAG: hypothetical protein DRO88_03435 [Candidatus Lokiarchaeia archaeon]